MNKKGTGTVCAGLTVHFYTYLITHTHFFFFKSAIAEQVNVSELYLAISLEQSVLIYS